MAPKLSLPFPYCLVSLHFAGVALPNGATCTFGVLPTDTSTPVQIATTIKAQLRATAGPFGGTAAGSHNNQTTLLDVTVKQGPMETGAEGTVADGAPLNGGVTNGPPPNVAYLVTKNTAQGGKRGKGRMYLPGLSLSGIGQSGNFVASTQVALQNGWQGFLSGLQGAGIGMSLLHQYDTAKGQTPLPPTTITSLTVSSLLATQRNRLRR